MSINGLIIVSNYYLAVNVNDNYELHCRLHSTLVLSFTLPFDSSSSVMEREGEREKERTVGLFYCHSHAYALPLSSMHLAY